MEISMKVGGGEAKGHIADGLTRSFSCLARGVMLVRGHYEGKQSTQLVSKSSPLTWSCV